MYVMCVEQGPNISFSLMQNIPFHNSSIWNNKEKDNRGKNSGKKIKILFSAVQ